MPHRNAGKDLGIILMGAWQAECDQERCSWGVDWHPNQSKATIIRKARAHVAATGHAVDLVCSITQRVYPR